MYQACANGCVLKQPQGHRFPNASIPAAFTEN
jgi:hypothetical protein